MKAYPGCTYASAAVLGSRLMKNQVIRKEIEQLKQNHMNRELLKQEDIFQKYMDIAFADVTDYVSFGRENIQVMGAFGPVMVENKETGEKEVLEKEVNTVKFKQSEEVDGTLITEVKQGKDGASIKLVDKMKALQWLADHMDIATVEQKAKIEQIRAKTEQIRHSETDTGEDAVHSWMEAVKKARESDGQ